MLAVSCTAQRDSIELSTHRFQPGHLRDRGPQLLGIERGKRTDAVAAGERRGFAEVRIFDVGVGQLALAQIQPLQALVAGRQRTGQGVQGFRAAAVSQSRLPVAA